MDCDDGFVDRDFEEVSMEFCLKINELRLCFFFFFINFFIKILEKRQRSIIQLTGKLKTKKKNVLWNKFHLN